MTATRRLRISALRILLPRSYRKSAAHATNMGELGAKGVPREVEHMRRRYPGSCAVRMSLLKRHNVTTRRNPRFSAESETSHRTQMLRFENAESPAVPRLVTL
jgi:hypothetical protein